VTTDVLTGNDESELLWCLWTCV